MPIPPGIYDEVCKIIRTKIDAGVYERSNSSYRSRWFTVLKKGGITLRIVHSLKPLNAVTIQHSGVPPHTEQITEQFAGRACNGILDLYVGYPNSLWCNAVSYPTDGLDQLSSDIPRRCYLYSTTRESTHNYTIYQ